MPIFAKWRKLANLPKSRGRDALPGIYEIANIDKKIIYIGQSAKDVPNRIRQHLQKENCISLIAHYWRYEFSRIPTADEAHHIDLFLKNNGAIPRCNTVTPIVRNILKRYSERSQ